MSSQANMGLVSLQSQFVNNNQTLQFMHNSQSPQYVHNSQSHQFVHYNQSPQFSSPSMSSPPCFPAMNAQSSAAIANGDSWILNTSASHHITPDLTILAQSTPYAGSEKIIVGNGEGLKFQNIGHSTSQTPSNVLHLKNILHVPMLTVDLLSVKKLCKDNHSWFICDDIQFFV